jgi:hypothetical protein
MVVMLERLEKRPGSTPAVFPPLIITGTAFVFVFRVCPLPLLSNSEGGLYIGVFRSS